MGTGGLAGGGGSAGEGGAMGEGRIDSEAVVEVLKGMEIAKVGRESIGACFRYTLMGCCRRVSVVLFMNQPPCTGSTRRNGNA